jgi:hypothetical protein
LSFCACFLRPVLRRNSSSFVVCPLVHSCFGTSSLEIFRILVRTSTACISPAVVRVLVPFCAFVRVWVPFFVRAHASASASESASESPSESESASESFSVSEEQIRLSFFRSSHLCFNGRCVTFVRQRNCTSTLNT